MADTTTGLLATAPGDEQRQVYETYLQLVWKRFRRSKTGILGGLLIMTLLTLAVFADFFSPHDASKTSFGDSFMPPQKVHFIDADGSFHLRPFTYNYTTEIDPKTFETIWTEDTSRAYRISLFVRSWKYSAFGTFKSRLHLLGVEEGGTIHLMGTDRAGRDLWGRACRAGRISLSLSLFAALISMTIGSIVGIISGYYGGKVDWAIQRLIEFMISFPQLPLWMTLSAMVPPYWDSFATFIMMSIIFAVLGWTMVAREVRGKVMAFAKTDFILAAKEMGASDRRIILRHLFPNVISHVIVVLTLNIPAVILGEAFLSFIGIGIQEPLVSWGFLMKNAQNLETLGSHLWILSPSYFIIFAVLGFNFLGDGLRDAVDPYAIV